MLERRLLLAICLIATCLAARAAACPFCSAVSQTLTQEIEGSDVSVIARLIKLPDDDPLSSDAPLELDLDDPDSGTAEFEVVEVIRGEKAPSVGSTTKVVYFGGDETKKSFLINGLGSERIDWSTPLPLTERGVDYIRSLDGLPEKGPDRLAFFMSHLEDEDPLLAQDAYDEFGRAPYEEVIAVGDRMDRQQLIDWIEDSGVGPTRRRLYLTMLGICGQPEDIAILESLLLYDFQQMEPGIAASFAAMAQAGPIPGVTVLREMVKADVRRKQQCLDALIAAYLKLKGPSGLTLIEDRFLKNPAAEYTHVYAAIMALRFHGEETEDIPKPRLLETVRLVLDNPEAADQIIPDLARWEDWSVMDQLVTMFKTSEENAWIRSPVVSYLLAATEQPPEISDQANAALADLEKLDAKTVKQARSYMAFGLLARTRAKKKETKEQTNSTTAVSDVSASGNTEKTDKPSQSTTSQLTTATAEQQDESVATPVTAISPPGPSRLMIIGGPLVAGLFLFCIFALLLRGTDVRSTSNES